MKHNRFIIISSLISTIIFILLLNCFSPSDVGPVGVLLFFTTIYLMCLGVFTFFWKLFYKLALNRYTFRRKDYLYAAVAAFMPVMLLIARSFGTISIWTIFLIICFTFLAEFLVVKRS